jgi:hypothetical protein
MSTNVQVELVTPQGIEDLSETAANNMVDGMVAQDREDFETACFHFSIALRSMFPEYDGERIFKASEAYTSALFGGSKLKDDDKLLSKEETLHDDRWESVRSDLNRMCELLDIPKSYASETTEWFRYHGVRDDDYVKHLLESHRVFLKRVAGNDRFYRELSGLYLTGIALHDKHDKHVYTLGKTLMRIYFSLIFNEKYGTRSRIISVHTGSASS